MVSEVRGDAPRLALVTGAAGDVGSAVVAALVAAGWTVAAHVRTAERAADLEARFPEQVRGFEADLTFPGAATALVDAVVAWRGCPHALVHAATPKIDPAPVLDVSDIDLIHHLDVQVVAAANLVAALLPTMQGRQDGVIVGLLSTVIEPNRPRRWWPYTTAKFALAGLLAGLATDVEGTGVRAVGVMPAGIAGTLAADAGVGSAARLTPAEVAAVVVRAVLNPSEFPNGTVARLLSGVAEVGRWQFVGKPVAARPG